MASRNPRISDIKVDKSGKKFLPKAPARRPAAATPTQIPGRASVEPVQASQTPQPETIPQPANPIDPEPSQASIESTSVPAIELEIPQEPVNPTDSVTCPNEKGNTRVPVVEPETAHDNASRPQKRPRDEDAVGENAAKTVSLQLDSDASSYQPEQGRPAVPGATPLSINPVPGALQPGQSAPGVIHASQPAISTNVNAVQDEARSRSFPQPSVNQSAQDARPEVTPKDAPPAKRRRLRPDRTTKPSIPQTTQTLAPQRRSNIQVQVPPLSTEASSNFTPRPHGLRSGRTGERPAQPSKSTKKTPAKGKGNQPQGAAGAEASTDAVRGPTRRVKETQRNTNVRKPRQKSSAANRQRLQNAAAEIVADAVEGTTNKSKGRRGRKVRETTPEEAEHEIIAPGAIKMAELCKDTRRGKKSDILKALQERDKEELAREKQRELQRLVEGEQQQPDRGASGEQATSGAVDGDSRRAQEEVTERQEDIVREVADTYVDEHGQIRINTDSLRIDRHAQAAAAREQYQEEAVVENDLSKPAVNSATYSKREPLNSWPEQVTDEFYEALRTFGTDFGMISRMLRKTRRAIKLKFNREEKSDPGRINQALVGARIAIDLDEYSRRAGEHIEGTEEHERKMEEDRKKIEEDAADELRAKEEQEQLRREQAEKERAAVPDDSSGKENREAGKKRKKGRKSGEKRKDRSGRKKKGPRAEDVP